MISLLPLSGFPRSEKISESQRKNVETGSTFVAMIFTVKQFAFLSKMSGFLFQ